MASGFILGAVFGSFIGTLTQRWGDGVSISGRSRCDGCGRSLSILELIPLVSHLLQRGQCTTCGAAIGRRQLYVEAMAAAIGAAALLASPDVTGVCGALFGWALFALFLFDVEQFWLPNKITVPLGAVGLALGLGDMQDRVIGLAAGFLSLTAIRLAYFLVRKREGMGGGDPKLFAAVGAWLGWQVLPFVLIMASMIGLAVVGFRAVTGKPISGDVALPFGALMAVAAFVMWLLSIALGGSYSPYF